MTLVMWGCKAGDRAALGTCTVVWASPGLAVPFLVLLRPRKYGF